MIAIPTQYSYLVLSVTACLTWLVVLYLNRGNRVTQLIVSLVFSPVGPISEILYIPDYWHPSTIYAIRVFYSYFSPEDVLFSFAIFGIISALPNFLLAIQGATPPPANSFVSLIKITLFLAVLFVASVVIWKLGVNSIYATSFAMIAVAGFLLIRSKDMMLLRIGIIGAAVIPLLLFTAYWIGFELVSDSEKILRTVWTLYDTPLGGRFVDVPITELVWGFSFGGLFSVLFAKYRI